MASLETESLHLPASFGKILDIPIHHLDRHMLESEGKKRDKQEFIETQKAMLEKTAWVVEVRFRLLK